MFEHRATLRFSDTDAMGHVNHARFATLLEDARIALMEGEGRGLTTGGMILARLEIDYIRPLMLSAEPVVVRLWVSRVGTSSFEISYELEHRGQLSARGRSVQVAYDYQAERSRPLSAEERGHLEAILEPAPAG